MAAPATNATATEQLFNPAFFQSSLFWTGLAFAVMLFIIWKYVTPALAQTLDERAARIREDLDNASQLRNEAQQTLANYEKQLRAAKKEASDMLTKAKKDAELMSANKMAELERDLSRRSEEARLSIEQAKNKAISDVREQAVEMAIAAAERILEGQVDSKKASALADKALKDLKH